MSTEAANRLMEFARACKAATRVVSMYPPTHPAIQSALARMVTAGTGAVEAGPLTLTVLPDTVSVDGRVLPKPDTTVSELAALLHQHRIGELRVRGALPPAGWHLFLTLLATAPEDIRGQGGIAHAWDAAGGGPIEIKEIDYAEVLREREGSDADWDDLIANCLSGDSRTPLDERALHSLLEIARDPERLGEFLSRLQERARAAGLSAEAQRNAVLRLLHGLANYAAQHSPDEFDQVMNNLAAGATRLNADLMWALLNEAPPAADGSGLVEDGVDLGGELRSRTSEEQVGSFVAENVIRDRGATGRLAAAFHALASDEAQRRAALALAEERVLDSPVGADPQFEDLWSNTVSLLMSYTDADYVPDDYDRELTSVQDTTILVDQITDDPPDRIAAWLSTVADTDVRALDQQLLVDLIRLEDRPDAWLSVLELAVARIDQLALVNDLALAAELIAAIAGVAADPQSPFRADAARAIDGLTGGPLVVHLVLFARQAPDSEVPTLAAVCRLLGPGLIPPLVSAMSAEDNRLAVRRLKDVLLSYGSAAREPARALRSSGNAAVRRAAIDLLRALGGAEALAELSALLDDADPYVQRDALRAIIQIGGDEAFRLLERVLTAGQARSRDAVMQALGSLNDERAAPLLARIVEHGDYRGGSEAMYTSAIDALGRCGATARGLDALKLVLYRGQWWSPKRTARLRTAAARALHATASEPGDRILQEASTRGPRGVRRAASLAMTSPRRARPAGEPS